MPVESRDPCSLFLSPNGKTFKTMDEVASYSKVLDQEKMAKEQKGLVMLPFESKNPGCPAANVPNAPGNRTKLKCFEYASAKRLSSHIMKRVERKRRKVEDSGATFKEDMDLSIYRGSEEENHDEEILEVGEGDNEETPLTGFKMGEDSNLEEKEN